MTKNTGLKRDPFHSQGSVPHVAMPAGLPAGSRIGPSVRRPGGQDWCCRDGHYQAQPSKSRQEIYITHKAWGRDPGKISTYLNDSWLGWGGRGDTSALVSRDHNQQEKGTQTVAMEASRRAALGVRPAAEDSLIKLPLPNMLKGEGEELETGPGIEFILELHPV